MYRRLAFESVIFVLTCAVQPGGSLDLRGKVAANCQTDQSAGFSWTQDLKFYSLGSGDGMVKPLQLTSGGSAERLPPSVCSVEIRAVPWEWFRALHS